MTYKGSQVNKQTLDPTLQQEIEGIKSKVNSSWQKDVYNDANITNLGPLSASRVFNFNDWDDDNSKLDSLYINIPVGNAFSGLIKLTLSGDWNVGNSMGGAEVVYNFSKVGNVVGTNTMTINYISPLFATCFYIRKLVEDVSRVYIPITKAPNTRNGVSIKVEIFSTYNIFDVVNRITVARDPAISQPHPWTPQIPSAVQHGTGNNYILGGAMTLGGNLSISKDIPLIEMGVPNSNSGSSAQFLLNASTTQDFGLEFRKNNVTYMVAHGQKQVAFLGHDDVWFTIQDLKQSASDVKTNVAAAITDKGVSTSPTATGAQMATNIRAIQTGKKTDRGVINIPALNPGQTTSVNMVVYFKPSTIVLNLDGRYMVNGQMQGTDWAGRHSVYDIRVIPYDSTNWLVTFFIRGGTMATSQQYNYALFIE
ncbi:hypothetical protein C3943_08085 [Lysinibacillus sp. B2A1]|nr:hypothetical protein C3943_08085 [Lysinibacillus sp. B2A1]